VWQFTLAGDASGGLKSHGRKISFAKILPIIELPPSKNEIKMWCAVSVEN